ncbi:uncharacterized protein LOC142319704 [Lycorma delicatula]|uniref:uncharacterized protein LOC142319704 n=1 Tax=Lycorma delicatula TaxID=130591 RepID=UPI003F50E122
MKLNPPYFKRINYPKWPVPFEQYLPLKLKNRVSGKGQKTNDIACVQEMFVLFGCLKKNEFASGACAEEVNKFKKCYYTHLSDSKKRDELMRTGVPQPGAKNLNHMQLNTLLNKYPT